MSDNEKAHKALLDKHITIPTLQAKIAELEADKKILVEALEWYRALGGQISHRTCDGLKPMDIDVSKMAEEALKQIEGKGGN